MLYRWRQEREQQSSKERLSENERAELNRLRKKSNICNREGDSKDGQWHRSAGIEVE